MSRIKTIGGWLWGCLLMREVILLEKKLQIGRKNARKNEKKIILNEYISLTGFNRKYAITKINSCIKRKT